MLAPYWLFMLGALFILVTLLLPKGIVGTFNAWWEPWKQQRIASRFGERRGRRRRQRTPHGGVKR